MRNLRPHIAVLLLAAAMLLALPRTWVHSCIEHADAHMGQSHDGTQDEIAHADCLICGYAPISSFEAAWDCALTPPQATAPRVVTFVQALPATQVQYAALRGPPSA